LWDAGWFTAHKIGRSDDAKAFRRLFATDTEFHKLLERHVDLKSAAGPDGTPDNWLVGKLWFEKAIAVVEKHGLPDDFIVPQLLYGEPARCQMRYAAAIQEDGHLGEAASAWKEAAALWSALGDREFARQDGTKVRLKDDQAMRVLTNYEHWKNRCHMEQTEPALTARRLLHQARQVTTEKAKSTKDLFDQAFRAWAALYKEHPWLIEDEDTQKELASAVRHYQSRVLKSKELPKDFPLRHVLESGKVKPGKK
jgi:hypothetical protein